MRKHLKHFLMLAVMTFCFAATTVAQGTVKGKVVDAENNEPLIGATVSISGTTLGTVTDVDGNFVLKVTSSHATLEFKYLGYKDKQMEVTAKRNVDLGEIALKLDAQTLGDVVVTSTIAVARKTPVAVSNVMMDYIEEKMGTQEFPEILKATPGVHANKGDGGYGDSEIYMRGFGNENTATVINGVPVNDMENGNVYQSNWQGLRDVTSVIQTQRGVGASKVSAPSIGGTINIITKGVDAKQGGSIHYGMSTYGQQNMAFSLSSGMSKSGWAVSLLGSKAWGSKAAQGTDYESYTYFLSVAKRLNDAHQLTFTAFGSPQTHYKNGGALKIADWKYVKKVYGVDDYRFNATYGFDKNGRRKTSAYNEYHKPQISLNHQWNINEKSSLSTVAYVSIGRGNGYGAQGNDLTSLGLDEADRHDLEGAYKGELNMKYRNADGTFNYAAIQELNEKSEVGSRLIMSKSKNDHNWYGLISTYTTKIGEHIDFYGGVDYRYYKGTHTNEICDLYSGDYFIDSGRFRIDPAQNSAAADPNWKYQKLGVGDAVYRDYDSYVMQEGAFFQAEYSKDKLTAFLSGAVSNTAYWRYDRLYYDEAHAESKTVDFWGFNVKGGANYNLTENHNVFANLGFISRAPKFAYGAFLNPQQSNVINKEAKNEKVFMVDLGYGFKSSWLTANVTGYYTKWMDKTMTKNGTLGQSRTDYFMNMAGVDALHTGVEVDFKLKPFRWLDINGMFSWGDWRWDSNATGYAFDENGTPLTADGKPTTMGAEDHASATINLDGIRVGGSAQTTAALGANVNLGHGFRIGADWTYYARNYAYYSFTGSNLQIGKEVTIATPWEIPASSTIDMNASYRFKIGGVDAILSGNVNNLLNYQYIYKAWNPEGSNAEATAENIYCYFDNGRTFSVRLKLKF
ncbi:TonB-dependent outer membrane receptor protein [gut metagenome]|uniref:TonB-dependent outer membrane receptor protein n=1 Tax=gut metagenome TaxID=749906 RepID=J9GT23_9ZZZZ